MAEILDKSYWIINENALLTLGSQADARLADINDAINSDLDAPLRIHAALTPDTNLYIRQQNTPMGDGGAKTLGPINNLILAFADSTIDFQNNTTTGSPISISFPASTVGFYRRCVLSLDNTGTLIAAFTPEVISLGSLANAGAYFLSGAIPIGWIDLECTNASGKFKTAGSSSSVIENSVSGIPRIFRVPAGSGSGSGGGNTGVAQEVPVGAGQTSLVITFPSPLIGVNYVPIVQFVNLVDPDPQFQTIMVTNKTINGFTANWNAETDSASYSISYIVPVVQEQVGEVPVSLASTSITVPLPIVLLGNVYSVVAQLVNYVDAGPQYQPVTITQKTGSLFSAAWNAETDSGDYKLTYHLSVYT